MGAKPPRRMRIQHIRLWSRSFGSRSAARNFGSETCFCFGGGAGPLGGGSAARSFGSETLCPESAARGFGSETLFPSQSFLAQSAMQPNTCGTLPLPPCTVASGLPYEQTSAEPCVNKQARPRCLQLLALRVKAPGKTTPGVTGTIRQARRSRLVVGPKLADKE